MADDLNIETTLEWVRVWERFNTFQQMIIVSAMIGRIESKEGDMTSKQIIDYFWNILFTAQVTLEGKNK